VARFFFDRDTGKSLGLALRHVGVDVQLHSERYSEASPVPDDRWISEVTADGYVIVTHDSKIRSRRAEHEVFRAAGAKAVVLATRSSTRFDNLRALMIAWDRINRILDEESAPSMIGIDKAGTVRRYI